MEHFSSLSTDCRKSFLKVHTQLWKGTPLPVTPPLPSCPLHLPPSLPTRAIKALKPCGYLSTYDTDRCLCIYVWKRTISSFVLLWLLRQWSCGSHAGTTCAKHNTELNAELSCDLTDIWTIQYIQRKLLHWNCSKLSTSALDLGQNLRPCSTNFLYYLLLYICILL